MMVVLGILNLCLWILDFALMGLLIKDREWGWVTLYFLAGLCCLVVGLACLMESVV